jgi:site-specific DNA-methyltransferase (adenine-specific)
MGKSWDSTGIAFNVEVWTEALRVLKPGGHLLAFSGSRTYHRMAVAIEDAGFQIRDQIMWLYGSGFPKSMDVSKAIDKSAGALREILGTRTVPDQRGGRINSQATAETGVQTRETSITAPATAEAQQWQGWGTALKPAHEPIVLARKPLIGTVAANVLEYGTGGLNIDGSRVGSELLTNQAGGIPSGANHFVNSEKEIDRNRPATVATGRFPANIIHDGSDEITDLLGEPARFFYCAKASKRDRNEGLDGFEGQSIGAKGNGLARICATCGASTIQGCECPDRTYVNPTRQNHHPTVKPTDLMRYLVKLITPLNGIVLDPFTGSGSTGKGAVIEGFTFIGIELDPDYVAIATARIQHQLDNIETTLFTGESS